MEEIRCSKCGKLLGKIAQPVEFEIKCPRCKTVYKSKDDVRLTKPSSP